MSEVTAEMIERGRGNDPRAAAKRRRVNQSVRETRARLTSGGTGNPVFDHEVLRLYAQSVSGASPAMGLLALAIGAMSLCWLPIEPILMWLSLVTIGILLNYGFARRFLKLPEARVKVRAWQRNFAIGSCIQGLLWATVVGLLMRENDATAHTFMLFVLLLITAMTAMVSAAIPLAVICGLAPVMLAVGFFLTPTNDLQSLPISLSASGAMLFFIILARRLYSTAVDTLSLSMEKEALIAELE